MEDWNTLFAAAGDLDEIEKKIAAITPDESRLCPPKHLWFEWARLTPLADVRVIILGQDPFFTQGTANGLAFACTEKKVPPSLRNIYECLYQQKLIRRVPNHGRLDEWARQGVLLLNTALSTELGEARKHMAVWAPFVRALVHLISEHGKRAGVRQTYLLWGGPAATFAAVIDGTAHDVLTWLHPSPLAQARAPERKCFVHCPHFRICTERYGVDWNLSSYDDALKRETI